MVPRRPGCWYVCVFSQLIAKMLYFFLLTYLGITVAAVVVPQSMAYAKLAGLAPEYGLYSSFMGVVLYWFFATSKDITIGVSWRRAPL
jgi:MFS superfamily sulfate permease-like transporter